MTTSSSHVVVARTRDELTDLLAEAEAESAVVMTMGALHAGHAALIRAARGLVGDDGRVIVTVFVNPLQFGPEEDLDRYPRSFDADLAICAEEGADVVFAPDVDEMYPGGEPLVTIDPGALGRDLEGAARPGHFAGVLTVVTRLLNLTVPSYAVFGEKDYQQLTLVRQLVTDLELPFEIVGVPTVREDDGLALSSRNRYLSEDHRQLAATLSASLRSGAAAGRDGRDAVLAAAQTSLDAVAAIEVAYLELRTPDLREPAQHGPARLLIAAHLGGTRLIDNVAVELA